MQIHPPEGPVRSIKDFLVHLFMITLGILIALGLEAPLMRRLSRMPIVAPRPRGYGSRTSTCAR